MNWRDWDNNPPLWLKIIATLSAAYLALAIWDSYR